jgi:DNA-binding response OmpR family regulator
MKKLLLIDDDQTLLDMYCEFLSHNNYAVDMANSGPSGISKAIATPYDAILLDVMMPNMDGMQVLAVLKKDARTQQIPVIFLSNVADEKYILASRASGAVGYIVKTNFDLSEILAQINLVVSGQVLPTPIPEPDESPLTP